jgi:hypothetical protein
MRGRGVLEREGAMVMGVMGMVVAGVAGEVVVMVVVEEAEVVDLGGGEEAVVDSEVDGDEHWLFQVRAGVYGKLKEFTSCGIVGLVLPNQNFHDHQ